ncbi:MAG: efflux RND transporter periplasmic adaptor subunit [Planctomycetota bacterium]|nr:efflux RND transporter periplasmic adaptor subunit [Planctomycetota bacterium]
MTWRRRVGWGVALLAVAAATVYGYLPRPVPVDLVGASRGPLRVVVQEEGKTRVIDRFLLSAPVAGFARRVVLDVGDSVRQGQGLVELEPIPSDVLDPRSRAEAEARVAGAQAALQAARERAKAARANAELAASELGRVRRLFEDGTVSRGRLDQAEAESRQRSADRRSAEFSIEVARFELEAAGTALRYSAADGWESSDETVTIRAPVSGRVLEIIHRSEGVVKAGEALIELGDPVALEVEIDVLSGDAVRMAPGTPVVFERWGGATDLEGRVRVVEPVAFTKISALGVEEQRVLVIADITSPAEEWERLGDGYRVEATFIIWEGEDVLQVPTSALFRHGDGWATFVVAGGTARRRPVEVGRRSGLRAEIVEGLTVGEPVITHPDDSVSDGTAVRPR